MYTFRDTVKGTSDVSTLPSEAMSWNGAFLENQIEGYQTLGVKGRELVTTEYDISDNNAFDGAKMLSRKRPARVITVYYQLICSTNEAFREAYNKLNSIFTKEKTIFYFNDEPDKYFEGIVTLPSETPEGRNSIKSSFEIFCPDPFKSAIALTPITATTKDGILSMDIDYDGTVETPLELTIHNNTETGYLSALGMVGDQNTFLTQLGYVDEADGETRTKMSNIYPKDGGVSFDNWQDANTFYENSTKKVVTTMSREAAFGGWLGKLPASFSNSGYSYYGACKELILPTPTAFCYLWARAWFETGVMGQTGEWCLAMVDEDNYVICGMALEKNDAVGNSASVKFLLGTGGGGSKVFKEMGFTPYCWLKKNPYGSESRNTDHNMFDLKKEGEKITYFFNGAYYVVNAPELKAKKVKRIQLFIGQYGSQPASKLVTHMGIRDVMVTDLKSQYWQDLPNRFAAKTDVLVGQEKGMHVVYRDGIKTLEDVITGSTFPTLLPGKNHIEFNYSGFTTTPPTITGTYRKRWY